MSNDHGQQCYSPWFPPTIEPARVGVYRLTNCAVSDPEKVHGWAYSIWDGRKWLPFGRWGHYPDGGSGFHWSGLAGPVDGPGPYCNSDAIIVHP